MNNGIHVTNNAGFTTVYTVADLTKIARNLAKGRGKLVAWRVDFHENGNACVVATVESKDGWRENFNEAI